MSQNRIVCTFCGGENNVDAVLCKACGRPLATQPAMQAAGKPVQHDLARTMLMGASPVAPPSQPKVDLKKTMLGLQSGGPGASSPADFKTGADDRGRTSVGSPSPLPPTVAAPRSAPATAAQGKPDLHKTVLGMPAASLGLSLPADIKTVVDDRGRTAVGTPSPLAPSSAPTVAAEPAPSESAQPSPTADIAPEPRAQAPSTETPYRSGAGTEDRDDDAMPRRRSAPVWLFGLLAGLAVVVIGAIAFMLLSRKVAYTTQITPDPDGSRIAIVFNIPGAPQGAVVELSGTRQPVANGMARFDVPLDQLKLGDNQLHAVYQTGSRSEPLDLAVTRRHQVALDLGGLGTSPPFFEAVFTVAPGESLAVAGQAAVLDGQNAFRHKVDLTDAVKGGEVKDNQLVYRIPFQLKNGQGQVDSGEYLARLPLTNLRVDRPAAGAVVDSATVVCSGETEDGAAVTVNGERTAVTAGRFEVKVPLVAGENPVQVTSRSTGKAPHTINLQVKRVASLEAAAAAWAKQVDSSVDYPALGRDPDSLVGRKVRMAGRIVNIRTEQGVTVFLLYVSAGCPKESRCGVYVVFKGESQAGLYSWVTVYGEVKGRREVQIKEGVSMSVPALEAAYVLAQPSGRAKKPKKR